MRRIGIVIVLALVVGVVVDIVVHADMPGYGVGIGLLGAALLTYGSKALAALIKRPPDYYDHLDVPLPEGSGDD